MSPGASEEEKEATAAAKKSRKGSVPAFEGRKHGKMYIWVKGDV